MLSLPWSVGSPAVAWGRVAGLLLQFTLLIQLVIIGRITWIEQSFGHDGLNRAHRFIGYALVALLIAHPLFLSIGYGLMQSKGLAPAFVGLATQWDDVLNAVIATLLFVGVVALSVPWVRRRLKYEYWHLAHLLTYAAIALSFGHQMSGGDFRSGALSVYWYLINFGIFGLYFLYRFLRPLVVYAQHRFVVERVERVSPDAWSIVVTGRGMASFRFRAGQFATLQFATRGLWTPHPFSFSREYDGRTMRFTVKELGDATRHIEALRPRYAGACGRSIGRIYAGTREYTKISPHCRRYRHNPDSCYGGGAYGARCGCRSALCSSEYATRIAC
jgi:predicted ferric reductase